MIGQKNQNSNTNKKKNLFLGAMLLVGGLVGQCAGGKVPDNPSPITLLTFILCLFAAISAFSGVARKTVAVVTVICLALTCLTIFAGPSHWILGGIWLFDIVAFLALLVAAFSALNHAKTPIIIGTAPPGHNVCDKCGKSFKSNYYLEGVPRRGYLCRECRLKDQ